MKVFENTIEYHELILTIDNLNTKKNYKLPSGYKFVFWNDKSNINDWINIHIETGEFASLTEAKNVFDKFYGLFYSELNKRCFFIEDEFKNKVATATLSPANEFGYNCVIDWLAVSGKSQGKGLSKPLIAKCLEVAKKLGYNKILLHTQTTTWLAAKLYLDFGFKPMVLEDKKGWEILKTITHHPQLSNFNTVSENEIFDPLMIKIKQELKKLHSNFTFNVWYINGRNDVYVCENGKFYEYKFFKSGENLKIKRVK